MNEFNLLFEYFVDGLMLLHLGEAFEVRRAYTYSEEGPVT